MQHETLVIANCRLPIANLVRAVRKLEIGNRQLAIELLKALQRLRLIVVRVKDGQQFCYHEEIPDFLGQT